MKRTEEIRQKEREVARKAKRGAKAKKPEPSDKPDASMAAISGETARAASLAFTSFVTGESNVMTVTNEISTDLPNMRNVHLK